MLGRLERIWRKGGTAKGRGRTAAAAVSVRAAVREGREGWGPRRPKRDGAGAPSANEEDPRSRNRELRAPAARGPAREGPGPAAARGRGSRAVPARSCAVPARSREPCGTSREPCSAGPEPCGTAGGHCRGVCSRAAICLVCL